MALDGNSLRGGRSFGSYWLELARLGRKARESTGARMTDKDITRPGQLLAGKRGLIMGVANDRSIAWGIARMAAHHGAELAFTFQGEALERRVRPLAESVGAVQRLWVPFRDLTSGIETYGGGRYLDLDRTATGLYDLDFNRAYQPYCVYDPGYVCPYPPSENRLPVAIRAGERLTGSTQAK